MIVNAIYVTTEDGRVILAEKIQPIEGVSDDILLGGVLKAIRNIGSRIKKDSEMNSLEIEGLSYHIKSFGVIRIVLVTDVPKLPKEIVQMLGFRFINEYGDVLTQTDYNINIFNQFKDIIREIIPQKPDDDDSLVIEPAVILGTWEIFNLPVHLQKTALTLISLVKCTIEDIAQESRETLADIERNLNTLLKMGFIGKRQINGETTYFCSIHT